MENFEEARSQLSDRERLGVISRGLLGTEKHYAPENWPVGLDVLFHDIAGAHASQLSNDGTRVPAGGIAISPLQAIRCIRDELRTLKFVRGLHDAVGSARDRFSERIEVLYAGCGPFASLAVPLTAEFSADQVHVTALDIHRDSLAVADALTDSLDIGEYFTFVQGDATEYVPPSSARPHVIVTETMYSALLGEPQASIVGNLAQYLREGGHLVPERVSVDASMLEAKHEHEHDPRSKRVDIALGNVFTLTRKTRGRVHRICKTLPLPKGNKHAGNHHFLLNTHVQVYGEHALNPTDSSITKVVGLGIVCLDERSSAFEIDYHTGDPRSAIQLRLIKDETPIFACG